MNTGTDCCAFELGVSEFGDLECGDSEFGYSEFGDLEYDVPVSSPTMLVENGAGVSFEAN